MQRPATLERLDLTVDLPTFGLWVRDLGEPAEPLPGAGVALFLKTDRAPDPGAEHAGDLGEGVGVSGEVDRRPHRADAQLEDARGRFADIADRDQFEPGLGTGREREESGPEALERPRGSEVVHEGRGP